jgi:acetylornithine deacetylase/succinyl-diaminopimelate desuccinylase-like protein
MARRAYGVMAALEVLRTLVEANYPSAARIEVVTSRDEESTAGLTEVLVRLNRPSGTSNASRGV